MDMDKNQPINSEGISDLRPEGIHEIQQSLRELSLRDDGHKVFFNNRQILSLIKESQVKYVISLDISGKLLAASDTFGNLLGKRSDLLAGQSFLDYIEESDRENFVMHIKKLSRLSSAGSIECRILATGGWRWILWTMEWLSGEGDNPDSMACVGWDITNRKQTEQVFYESEARFRQIFDGVDNGIAIYEAVDEGADFLIKDFNQAAEKATKVSRDAILGQRVSGVFSSVDQFGLMKVFRRVWKTGIPEHYPAKLYQDQRINFWTENYIFKLKSGEIAAIFQDVTEQKRMEADLRYHAGLLDCISDAVISLDKSQIIQSWNLGAETIYGWKRSEAIGKSFAEIMPTQLSDGTDFNEIVRRSYKEVDWRGETIQKTKAGLQLFTFTSLNVVKDTGSKTTGIVVVSRDITKRKQAEQKAADEAERRRVLFEQTRDGIVVLDDNGHVVEFNQQFADMLDYTREEISQLSVFDWECQRPRDKMQEDLRRGIGKGDLMVSKHRRKDGSIYDAEIRSSEVVFDGQRLHFCVCRDITQRIQDEEALIQSEVKFRTLSEQSPNMIYINKAGRVVYANHKCEEITGYKRTEFYSPEFDYLTLIAPEFRDTVKSTFIKRLQGYETETMELAVITKTGKRVDILHSAKVIEYEGGKAILGIDIDVTERKQAEEKLKLAAQEWRTTFDSIPDMVYLQDQEGRITRMNKAFAQRFHKTPKQLVGKSCCEVIHGTNTTPVDCLFQKMLLTRRTASAEYYEPGLGLHIHESISPILNEKAEIIGSVNILRDITQQKIQKEQLMMADRLATIGELAAGVAHELNNPLTSVIGFSQVILDGEIPPEVRNDLCIINTEAQRAAKIVKNLLTFSRKNKPIKQINQINNCLNEVLNLRAYEHKCQNIKIVNQLEADLPPTMFDYFQLQQVFINLIINAEYFMIQAHKGGTLTVTSELSQDIIRISIADDGPGMTEETLKHLFNPFFTTKEVGKGTGLGLSICHGIISEHNGKIYVQSEPGRGAAFIIELPVKDH